MESILELFDLERILLSFCPPTFFPLDKTNMPLSSCSKAAGEWTRLVVSFPQSSRILALTAIILFGSLIIGTVNVATMPLIREHSALNARQFQLGSILGVKALQVGDSDGVRAYDQADTSRQ